MKTFIVLLCSHTFVFIAGGVGVFVNRVWLGEKFDAIRNVFKSKQD